jgi:thiamine-monophosphate kinase
MFMKKSGEFAWIDEVRRQFGHLVPAGTVGIGDDGAVIPLGGGRSLVVTTDMLVEDVHFVRAAISPQDLGYKSLAVNLSDLAAMGAKPVASFLSIGFPGGIDERWRAGFLSGYRSLSDKFDVPLLGGDTTTAERIVISVTALGTAPDGRIKRRDGARVGDVVCVTGPLGDSAAGLLLQGKNPSVADRLLHENDSHLMLRHTRPEPHVREGTWLSGRADVHAMMDVSDGIASDLRHILEESGVSAIVDRDRLPVSPALREAAERYGWEAEKMAATGGEDYVLLLTVERDSFDELNKDYKTAFDRELIPIGEIVPGEPEIGWRRDGVVQPLDWRGFTHF